MEMFHRSLGQVLPFGNRLWLRVSLGQDAANTTLAEFNGKSEADGATANNHDISVKG
jgi:hypothetical protein